ncbi:hypothetical protein Q3C01_28130 [Bradyrhizobium sp. UFLA05-109]
MSAPYSLNTPSNIRGLSMWKRLRELWRPYMMDGDGSPEPFTWAANGGYAACFDPNSGRIFATIWNDGHGKFYPVVFVPMRSAIRIIRYEPVMNIRLRALPRIAIELLRLKCSSMREAQYELEMFLMFWEVV